MESMCSIPPPLSKCLHQNAANKALRKQTHDRLEAGHTHQGLCIFCQGLVPSKEVTSTTPTCEWKKVKPVKDRNRSMSIMLNKKNKLKKKKTKLDEKWSFWVPTYVRKTCICIRMLGHAFVWTVEHGRVRMKSGCISMKKGCARMNNACVRININRMGSSIVSAYHWSKLILKCSYPS